MSSCPARAPRSRRLVSRVRGAVGHRMHTVNGRMDWVLGWIMLTLDSIGAVESVKAASDIYAPVGGIVEEINEALNDQPNLLNKKPEGDGECLFCRRCVIRYTVLGILGRGISAGFAHGADGEARL